MSTRYLCIAKLLLIIAGSTTSVIVQLSSFTTLHSSCQSGFVDEVDQFYFLGSIDTTSVNVADRPDVLFELKRTTSSVFDSICSVNLNTSTCSVNQTSICYCRNKANSVYEIVFNVTATVFYSGRDVQLSWLNGLYSPDVSNIQPMPQIYAKQKETLTVNGKEIKDLTVCIIPKSTEITLIKWCVTNLLDHTLALLYNDITVPSSSDCIEHMANTSMANFTVSYVEATGCERKGGPFACIFNELTTSMPTTVNTTNATTVSCSTACKAVIVIHGSFTLLEAIITIIILLILKENTPLYVSVPASITLAALELVQIALIIVNGVQDVECQCDTTVPLWGIMLIYQFGTNGIFIVFDVVYLVIKISCNTSKLLDKPWITVVVFICIHSVVGIIALPFVFIYKYTASSKKISGDVPLNENGHHSTTRPEKDNSRDSKFPKANSSHSHVIDSEIKHNTEGNAAPTNGEERSKGKKKKRSKRTKKQHKDNNEIDATSSTSGVEVNLKEPEDSCGKIYQTNQGADSFKKRPPSVEITNKPNQITPRPLPQARGAGELPPIRNK